MADIVIKAYEDLNEVIRFSEVDEDDKFLNWLETYELSGNDAAGALWGTLSDAAGSTALITLAVSCAPSPDPTLHDGYIRIEATAAETGTLQDPVGGGASIESGEFDVFIQIRQAGHANENENKRLGLFTWALSKSVSN